MAKVTSGEYEVEIISQPGEQAYDRFYGNQEYLTWPILLRIHQSDNILKTVLINSDGGGTTVHPTSFVAKKDRVAICCSDSVFCLSIPDLALLWQTKADQVTCFEIFPYQDDYIVHGELEVSRLDANGKIVWQQGGADIFVSTDNSTVSFTLSNEYIMATDWDGRKYKWDLDGNPTK